MREDLTDGRVTIRAYRMSDIPLLCDAVLESHTELSRWLPWCQPGYSAADSAAWVVSRGDDWGKSVEYSFVICDAMDHRFLGAVGLNRLDLPNRTGNLGWWVRSSATGRGVATAAAQLCAQFGFEDAGLDRIEIICATSNFPSIRVAEKLGAAREALLRKRIVINNQTHDALLFALLRGELHALP
ncbi:MAG: GNAT family N-acetyltransferase [Ignavibacteria bacterium]|nr:GNAT family N-acetyltransferase [Ignavibacteria bacterium]